MDRKRLTAQEQKDFIDICAAESLLANELLKKRLSDDSKQKIQTAKDCLQSVLVSVMDTMPYEQLVSYKKQMNLIAVYAGIKKIGNDESGGRYLSYDEINDLLIGCYDHCLMCDKDPATAKQCPLCKLSNSLPFDPICSKL